MHIEVWKSAAKNEGWYWHFRSKGRVTADSESFVSKAHAIRAAKGVVLAIVKPIAFPANWMIGFNVTERDGITRITWI